MREMKDSGIEWIGEIPTHWFTARLKYILSEPMKYGASESGVDYDETLPRYIRITDISSDGKLKEDGKISLSESQAKGYILKDNTVLFARSGGTVGKSFIYRKSYGRAAFAGYLISANVNEKISTAKWLKYYTESHGYWEWINRVFSQATIQNIGADKYSNMPIPIASLSEQQAITTFLDRKCAEIDDLVSDIERQIETLEQYKRSVITEAVTKGLKQDVEMKDSGIEWIGKVPSHWQIKRIKHLFSLRAEKNYKPLEKVQLLSLYTGIGVFPHGEREERGNKAVKAEGYNIVRKNDIVVNIILAWMGAIGISDYDGVTSPAYDVYKPNSYMINPCFYHYVFQTQGIASECYKYGRGIMMMRWRTYATEFKQIQIPYPPVAEQQAIADYLDSKCAEIESIIADKQKQLDTLDEYKKSLIYEYVTGKKEVPENE